MHAIVARCASVDLLAKHSVVGTPEYFPPEMAGLSDHAANREGADYNKGVDFWALGISLFNCLTGKRPFLSGGHNNALHRPVDEDDLYPAIMAYAEGTTAAGEPVGLWPRGGGGGSGDCAPSAAARSLIEQLLAPAALDRIDTNAIKAHPWFAEFDWAALRSGAMAAPWLPPAPVETPRELDGRLQKVVEEADDDEGALAAQLEPEPQQAEELEQSAASCTACGSAACGNELTEHPELPGCLLCPRCCGRVGREFEVDEDGYELQCRWCGVGGELVGCDDCISAFCRGCISRNFGPEGLEALLADASSGKDWRCFCCSPAALNTRHGAHTEIGREPQQDLVEEPAAVADQPVTSCTACGSAACGNELTEHPELPGCLLCPRCCGRVGREFEVDEDGYELQCRWCGVGGELVGCDNCISAFCRGCISRNFGPEGLEAVLAEKEWACFRCDRMALKDDDGRRCPQVAGHSAVGIVAKQF
eukprot:SAG22_NODE_331_length_12174_cov_12.920497_2_plen_477_part_00